MINKIVNYFKDEAKLPGKGGIYTGLSISIVLMYVVNNLSYMGIPQLTEGFVSCLWAINIVFGISVIGYFSYLLYKTEWYYHLVQALIYGSGALALYTIYRLFPFSLNNETLITGIKILLVLVAAGFILVCLGEFYRYIYSLQFSKRALAPKPAKIQYPESQVINESTDQASLPTETEPVSPENSVSTDQPPSNENPPKPADEPVEKLHS